MARTVFFSWQLDIPPKVGRNFLKSVLEEVCANLASGTALNEAQRIEVDSDTQGVAGQPPIAETIFKKIDAAGVFVADMTFAGTRLDGRPTPNPNVLIEYGWALKSLTNERVICVMNTAYGEPSAETLPFDLAHLRWPIRYKLPIGASLETKAKVKRELINDLKIAIQMSLGTVLAPVSEPIPPFPAAIANDAPARFRIPNESIGFRDDDFGENSEEVFLNFGPAMWLRLMPSNNPQKEWSTRDLKKIATLNSHLMPLIHGSGGYGYLRASDGIGMYRSKGGDAPDSIWVDSIAFAFKTGEVWGIETALLNRKDWLFAKETEKIFMEGLEMYSLFLKELGIEPPYRWMAGMVGVKGRQLSYPPPSGHYWTSERGPVCATDLITAEGQIGNDQSATEVLLPFFNKVFDECGRERPAYLSQ